MFSKVFRSGLVGVGFFGDVVWVVSVRFVSVWVLSVCFVLVWGVSVVFPGVVLSFLFFWVWGFPVEFSWVFRSSLFWSGVFRSFVLGLLGLGFVGLRVFGQFFCWSGVFRSVLFWFWGCPVCFVPVLGFFGLGVFGLGFVCLGVFRHGFVPVVFSVCSVCVFPSRVCSVACRKSGRRSGRSGGFGERDWPVDHFMAVTRPEPQRIGG